MSTPSQPTYFTQQREHLIAEVALSLEQVLQNINKLNRNLEQVIAVGHEFSSVEALWSQFENVMGKDAESAMAEQVGGQDGAGGEVAQDGGADVEEEEEAEETEIVGQGQG